MYLITGGSHLYVRATLATLGVLAYINLSREAPSLVGHLENDDYGLFRISVFLELLLCQYISLFLSDIRFFNDIASLPSE